MQVRCEAFMNEFMLNLTERGFCDTIIINQTLSLGFVGSPPIVFKPGMPFEGQIKVSFHEQSSLEIQYNTNPIQSKTI